MIKLVRVEALIRKDEGSAMRSRKKVDLARVRGSLNTVCPRCERSIPPNEVRRIDFDHVVCPGCGAKFVPGSRAAQSRRGLRKI